LVRHKNWDVTEIGLPKVLALAAAMSGATHSRREVAARKDWRAKQSRPVERKAMIDRAHDLPITKQAAALNISRGSVSYLPRLVSAADLALMQRIVELHLEFPFAGSRLWRSAGCRGEQDRRR
jgi:hypothetical protein